MWRCLKLFASFFTCRPQNSCSSHSSYIFDLPSQTIRGQGAAAPSTVAFSLNQHCSSATVIASQSERDKICNNIITVPLKEDFRSKNSHAQFRFCCFHCGGGGDVGGRRTRDEKRTENFLISHCFAMHSRFSNTI